MRECDNKDGTCSCCLMLQKLERLRTRMYSQHSELERECLETERRLNNILEKRVAMSVTLYSDANFQCVGPFDEDRIIHYEHAYINMGDCYNTTTGFFTVPWSGVYSLALTVYSDAGSQGQSLAACASLMVNGQLVVGFDDSNRLDQEDSCTSAVALLLNAGDEVTVNLPAGCFLCDDGSHYNTFSAFLLYLTEQDTEA
ncbi:complement C1q-like protein 4 [Plectropomus leopardus]|uniref:complement C1q-like protein 4 n=1 Tax=Plectropomus leopardus TaxID=160734 RepID=UPI001C4C4064|nr:complement C1q-like protein 4 [Plectropomus leopardus]